MTILNIEEIRGVETKSRMRIYDRIVYTYSVNAKRRDHIVGHVKVVANAWPIQRKPVHGKDELMRILKDLKKNRLLREILCTRMKKKILPWQWVDQSQESNSPAQIWSI